MGYGWTYRNLKLNHVRYSIMMTELCMLHIWVILFLPGVTSFDTAKDIWYSIKIVKTFGALHYIQPDSMQWHSCTQHLLQLMS